MLAVEEAYPPLYEESMNTVLRQEVLLSFDGGCVIYKRSGSAIQSFARGDKVDGSGASEGPQGSGGDE